MLKSVCLYLCGTALVMTQPFLAEYFSRGDNPAVAAFVWGGFALILWAAWPYQAPEVPAVKDG